MIYLDHAATTPVLPSVFDSMRPWLQGRDIANPGSIHSAGKIARKAIENARNQVAALINADPSEIYFTSGATESNNMWIKALRRHIVITSPLEHQSVLEPLQTGDVHSVRIRTEYVNVEKSGVISLPDLQRLLDEHKGNTGAVTIMWVNNELGTINPIRKIGELCKEYKVPFHTDAVQAVGHIPVDVKANHVDMLSLAGHKFGAPIGVGALYVSKETFPQFPALIKGGGQERGVRGGTENVAGIIGLGAASHYAMQNTGAVQDRFKNLRHHFLALLNEKIPGQFYINGNSQGSSIISMTIPGVESEALMLLLDQKDIYVSAGSACSAASHEPSHVLTGIGLSKEDASSTIRISLGYETTTKELTQAADEIVFSVEKIKSLFKIPSLPSN